nr:hypothetical protein [Allomuricauda sp.]
MDLSTFSTQEQNVRRRLAKIGDRFSDIGRNLTLGVTTPLAGLGAFALDAAADFETLEARLETALGSSSLAKETFEELKGFTKDLAITTEQAADSYIKLKNLGLDPTIEALTSYGNTAAAQGKSINQLIEAVADAATGEFERLKEFGIKANREGEKVTFTFQGLSTTIGNNAQEIQGYLQELGNTTFAGALESQANTFNGIIAILKDNVRTTIAEFGKFELDALKPIVNGLNGLFDSIRALSPEAKKFLVVFGGIAAAVGPLLALAGTILPAIGTGFALLTGPIGLIAAGLTAIGVIIVKNWAPIRRTLVDIANYFIDLYNEAIVFRVAVEAIRLSFNNIYDTGKFVFGVLGDIISALATNIKNAFISAGDVIKAVLTGDFDRLPELLKENFAQTTASFQELIKTATKDFEVLKGTIADNIQEGIQRGMNNRYELLSENVDTTDVDQKVEENTEKSFVKGVKKGVRSLASDSDLFKGLGTAFRDEFASAFGGRVLNREELDDQFSGFKSTLDQGNENLENFRERAKRTIQNTAVELTAGFVEIVAGIASGTSSFGDVGAFLLNTIGNLAIELGKGVIAISEAVQALKAVFVAPGAGLFAGLGLVGLGVAIKSLAARFAGNFTQGGIIGGSSFSGDRLLAGVNSGELILNVAQQRAIAGALANNSRPIILQPSLEYSSRGLIVTLQEMEELKQRST